MSLNETDTFQKLSKYSSFKKVERVNPKAGRMALEFQPAAGVTSVFGINIEDVNTLGGYASFNAKEIFCALNLTFKGEKSYKNILFMLANTSLYQWKKIDTGTEIGSGYQMIDTERNKNVMIYYDKFADIGVFFVMDIKPQCMNDFR